MSPAPQLSHRQINTERKAFSGCKVGMAREMIYQLIRCTADALGQS